MKILLILMLFILVGCDNAHPLEKPNAEIPELKEVCLTGVTYYWYNVGYGKTRSTALAPKWVIAPNGGNHLVKCGNP